MPSSTELRLGGEQHVPVRDHDALGRPGGARGVDERRHLVLLDRRQPLVELRLRDRIAAREKLRPGHLVGGLRLALQEHEVLEQRQLSGVRAKLGELLVILHHRQRRLGVRGDVRDLVGRGGAVDPRGRDPAAIAPRSAITHSGRFGPRITMREPAAMPSWMSARPARRTSRA